MKIKGITTEECLWLSLADAERDLAEVTKRLYDIHNEFRKYKLSKEKNDKSRL